MTRSGFIGLTRMERTGKPSHSLQAHRVNESRECINKMSDGSPRRVFDRRGGAWLQVELGTSSEVRNQSCQAFAPSHGLGLFASPRVQAAQECVVRQLKDLNGGKIF